MAKITVEQVKKLAELSYIEIRDEEISSVAKQIEDILTYAEKVKEIAGNINEDLDLIKNINIFSNDNVIKTDPIPILNNAPEREDSLFIVPKIIEDSQ